MKKTILIVLAILAIVSSPNIVEAKTSISIGTYYGKLGGDSSGEAKTAYTYADKMGYMSYLSTQPTWSTLSNYAKTFKNGGTNGLLFFHGHANSTELAWNYNNKGGDYAVGISRKGSYCAKDGYDFMGISEFKLSNAKLAIFMGCNTAQEATNLPSSAVSNGAKSAIGWKEKIAEGDTDKWVTRFYSNLASGGTIKASIEYANEFDDYKKSGIKSTKIYGASTSKLNSEDLDFIFSDKNINISKVEQKPKKIYGLSKKKSIEITDVIEYIKKSYDLNFNLNNYNLEVTRNEEETIYDFNLLIDGAKANIGYTVFVYEEKIIVIDNMNGHDESASRLNTCKLEDFDEEMLKQKALSKYQTSDKNIEITIDSTLKTFDVETNKKYYNVFIQYHNKSLDISSILVETYEI